MIATIIIALVLGGFVGALLASLFVSHDSYPYHPYWDYDLKCYELSNLASKVTMLE
jgi:hypothetical protein